MAAYPVRGLDINSSYTIYNLLNQQKENGVAVIFVGEDLDVLIELCDRILVIGSGSVSGIVDGRTATKDELGLLMIKSYNHTDLQPEAKAEPKPESGDSTDQLTNFAVKAEDRSANDQSQNNSKEGEQQ